jgi:hypothetical protein
MDVSTFLVTVYCLIDDWFKGQRVRQRGPAPRLSDSEVLTMEVVGEFLGIDTDSGLYAYFRRHWADWFPALTRVHRTTFTRQAANLWQFKAQLWQHLLSQIAYDPDLTILDSFPLPVIRFGRAHRCRRLRDWSAWGYDDVNRQPFFGLRGHVRVCWPGVVVGFALHPANLHDRWVGEDLAANVRGYLLGDTNYWSPTWAAQLQQQGACLLTPRKSSLPKPRHDWPRWLIHTRRRVETVISQFTERFQIKRIRVHDSWHLVSRCLRKVLSHTLAVLLCQQGGLDSSLQFAQLLTI